eukprot:1032974-Prorocentrum_minimum.AAC.1
MSSPGVDGQKGLRLQFNSRHESPLCLPYVSPMSPRLSPSGAARETPTGPRSFPPAGCPV